jgi:predicted kinase
MGLPGSGKSYFAKHLSRHLNIHYIGSDQTRKEMEAMGEYHAEAKEKVYQQMKIGAERALKQGKDVVLDATFYLEKVRHPFRSLAQDYAVPFAIIWIEAEERTTRERLSKPREDSEADYAVYLKLKTAFEPPLMPYLKIKSDAKPVSEMVKEAEEYLLHVV